MWFWSFYILEKGTKQCPPEMLFQRLMPQTATTHGLWFSVQTWEQMEELSLQTWSCTVSYRMIIAPKEKTVRAKNMFLKKEKTAPNHRQWPGVSDYKVINQSQSWHSLRHLSGLEPYMQPPIYTFLFFALSVSLLGSPSKKPICCTSVNLNSVRDSICQRLCSSPITSCKQCGKQTWECAVIVLCCITAMIHHNSAATCFPSMKHLKEWDICLFLEIRSQ